MTLDPSHLLDRATAWSHQAGLLARSRFGTTLSTDLKPDDSLVTEIDRQAQQLIASNIAQECPTHSIVAEEVGGDRRHAASEPVWIIDPLDGTRNFARGIPCFSVSIALMHGGRPILGVVHEPLSGRTFTAQAGAGAKLDGQRMAAPRKTWNSETVLGLSLSRGARIPSSVHRDWLSRSVHRNLGSVCLLLALTASGAIDACYGRNAKLWDLAAGALLVEESGGSLTTPRGAAIFPIDALAYDGQDLTFLAGAQPLHGELIRSLAGE